MPSWTYSARSATRSATSATTKRRPDSTPITRLIQVYLKEQSPDIAAGVDHSLEEREGTLEDDPFELQGAGDQGMMIGFACRETLS